MLCCLNPDCDQPLNEDTDDCCQYCGTQLESLLRNRFKIIKPLGRGGFGKTYLAEDIDNFNENCVVKQLVYQEQGTQATQKIVELFEREAKQLKQLKQHAQIPDLFAYFEAANHLYLVQQWIEGHNLLVELEQQGSFRPQQIWDLLLDLLPVIQFIHQRGVIHRDLKPDNIMRRSRDGKLVLIDFGIAKQLSTSSTSMPTPATRVGSFGYTPPEQLQEGHVFPASDLYGLGATCFHLLSSLDPRDLWLRQGYGWLNHWPQYLPTPLSPNLESVLNKLLQYDLDQRYQSADEVLQDLQVLQDLPTRSTTLLPPPACI